MIRRVHRAMTQRAGRLPVPGGASRAAPAVAVAALAVSLVACDGELGDPVTPVPVSDGAPALTPPPTAPAPATPIGGFGDDRIALGAVQWALALDSASGGPTAPVSAIPDDAPRFWAAVPLLRPEAGLRLRAEWTYNDTPMPALAAEIVVPEGGAGYAVFDLALPAAERWPVGDYAVTIFVDDEPVLSASVPVVASDSRDG